MKWEPMLRPAAATVAIGDEESTGSRASDGGERNHRSTGDDAWRDHRAARHGCRTWCRERNRST